MNSWLQRWAIMAVVVSVAWMFFTASMAGAKVSPPFGIERFTMETTGPTKEVVSSGKPGSIRGFVNEPAPYTQAGGHPYAITTTIEFVSETDTQGSSHPVVPTRDPKDAVVNLPQGLLADPQAVPRCPLPVILNKLETCPTDTQVGFAVLHVFGGHELMGPIVNLTPEAGQSAEFGIENATKFTYVITGHVVRIGSSYGLTAVTNELTTSELTKAELTFWGVPPDPSHDVQRGLICSKVVEFQTCTGGDTPSGLSPVPFWTMPTDCAAGPQVTTLRADSWEEPGRVSIEGRYEGYALKEAPFPAVTGCDKLRFDPLIGIRPDTLLADEPVGVDVNVSVPQIERSAAPATPEVRDAVVTMPEGLSISPGIVDGIQACNATGPEGINFTGPESEEVGLNGEWQLAPGHCPDASTIGTAEAVTPLLGEPVKGHIYLARPGCGEGLPLCTQADAADGNLYKLYLEIGGQGTLANAGVNIKLEGRTETNLATGQLTARFLENPELPFSELKVHLNGGPRAPLDTPPVCGLARTTADFTPWSAPGVTPEALKLTVPGTPDGTPTSFFEIEGCSVPAVFKPGFSAGSVASQAGRFSPFTLTLTRKDREQYLSGVQVHTPPGLLGMLSSVPLCGEPDAWLGLCPESSRIGSTRVSSGAGSHPFEIGGSVYLTGGYKGAPFGLSIVTHVVAGPFDLGLVVVRARINVDPQDSTLTVTSDPLPQLVFGIPLRLQRVTVNIDRPRFMFNPTNCKEQEITARLAGSQETVAAAVSPFAAGGCKSLVFKPLFKVTTSGRTSRVRGASLDTKLSYPLGSFGLETNIARVKVSLPRQLPSRLSTLQKACPARTFESNPTQCPQGSVVGVVRATTPVLPVGLTGPVYFVSHGGEAFPSLIIVLQGDGVRVDLTGATFIEKGITSSTFKTVPDVPVNTFELYLPQGRGSALAANGNLCRQTTIATIKRTITEQAHGHTIQKTITTHKKIAGTLSMPTEFVAQNGLIIKQTTIVTVTGCTHTATSKRKAGSGK
jgi:hypothetical protein